MISEIRIQNFKSIRDLTLKPGRVTVLIGENGSGKSNILESIAFAAGASANKLDNEFLFNRGIRVTEWKWMQSAFANGLESVENQSAMSFRLRDEEIADELTYRVQPQFLKNDGEFVRWSVGQHPEERDFEIARDQMTAADRASIAELVVRRMLEEHDSAASRTMIEQTVAAHVEKLGIEFAAQQIRIARGNEFPVTTGLRDFIIYAPENTVLRTPPPEGAIEPLGTKGEGLIRLLQSFNDPKLTDPELTGRFADLSERLTLFGWFEDFLAPDEAAIAQARLQIRDRWLAPERAVFDQRSANEGFLYVLFYLTLLMSWRTPAFFAIDNIDNALNPKLCAALMRQVVELARKYNKQVICTTHNPAVLDGLNLHLDDERLFAVGRDSDGGTVVRRVRAPQPQPGETPVRMSEAFTRGLIGGLPEHF